MVNGDYSWRMNMGTKQKDVTKDESVNTKANQRLLQEIVSFLPPFFFSFFS